MSAENPYSNFRFRLFFDGTTAVAGMTKVSGLTHDTEAVSFRAGAEPQSTLKIPGQSENPPIRMERGLTMDAALQRWVQDTVRRDIQIVLYDEAGQPVTRWNVHSCWASEYTALPDLDAEGNAVAIASLTIEHEGWDRDTPPPPAE